MKSTFFTQINKLVDWSAVETVIEKYYCKGQSVAGRPSYPGLLLFKMCLLQTWYGLSDYEVEEKVNDSLSFMQFVGLQLEDEVPDHSVISRFRTGLTKQDAFEKIFEQINAQLESKGLIVKTGAIVDATVTDSPRKPKGKTTYVIADDRKEEQRSETDTKEEAVQKQLIKITQPGVDTEAAWLKKAGKLHYGYKKHLCTDEAEGMVTAIVTTAANESDMHHITDVVDKSKLKKGARVKADKGYASSANRQALKDNGFKDNIMHKAAKNKPLTVWQAKFNQIISRTRYKAERTIGSMKRWFRASAARYIGLAKTHTQHLMEAIAYNLYRSPGIVAKNALLIR
ncbi:MAG: IS5 family transposase [Gloeobacteraceae cyanobacterium ES-bin-316]|nr:IS5 family transposase [Ferruginibacter sp.]